MVVVPPAVTVADWQAGVFAKLFIWPKHTWYVPTGKSVNTPQSSAVIPPTEIVPGLAGEVCTCRKPRCTNVPVIVVVKPAFTVMV